ncbi:MAG TPA: VOC family protein [Blastocatellia bacterium]|nr:VOC family protein [Blastocatellia bacterium]
MTGKVKHIPDGYQSVIPYLTVDGAAKLIEFLKQTFGATETEVLPAPDNKIGHAEVRIGDSVIMMGDAGGERKPEPTQAMIYVYVENADDAYKRALAAGATSVMEPADQFYGDRNAGVRDQWGNLWWIATHVEDVTPEELKKRVAAQAK